MAVAQFYNLGKIYRLNKKNKNLLEAGPGLLRAMGTHASGSALGGKAVIGLTMLLRLLPDESELDDKWWKKILRLQMKGEIISMVTPILKPFKNEIPVATDFITAVPYITAMEVFGTLFDIAKGVASQAGLRRKGSSPIEQVILYKKFPMENIKDLAFSLNTFIGSVVKSYTNFKHPYNLLQKEMKGWEKQYFKTTVSSKANVKTASPMSPYNDWVTQSFNKSDNHRQTAERLIEKYLAHYMLYKEGGYDDTKAANLAQTECEALLKRLCPLSIGTDDKGRALNLSKDEEFIFFLTNKAVKQIDKGILKKDDPLVHVNKMLGAVDEWQAKHDSVLSNVNWLIRNDESLKFDEKLKALGKIKQVNLKDLGFTVGADGKVKLDPRVQKAIEKLYKSK